MGFLLCVTNLPTYDNGQAADASDNSLLQPVNGNLDLAVQTRVAAMTVIEVRDCRVPSG